MLYWLLRGFDGLVMINIEAPYECVANQYVLSQLRAHNLGSANVFLGLLDICSNSFI